MENKPKRPPSVLIAQTILICLALIFLAAFLLVITNLFERPSSIGVLVLVRFLRISTISGAIIFLFPVSCLVAFGGLIFRKSFGRWMAVGILSIVFVSFFVGWLQEISRATSTAPMIGIVAIPVLILLLLPLIYQLIFGKRVAAYFRKKESPVNEPPPPPLFDS